MANKTTFVKLDRNILEWRWYKDQNTKALFIHLLLKANIRPHGFRTVTINRGELATSYASLAAETGLSIQNVRTALAHLETTGEVTRKQHSKFVVISIPQYDLYQSQLTGNQQATNTQLTGNQQQSKNDKKGIYTYPQERENRARGEVPASAGDVATFVLDNNLDVDPDAFWNYYEANGWVTKAGTPVRNWKALCRTWHGKPQYTTTKKDAPADPDGLTPEMRASVERVKERRRNEHR